jgi:hypothetical protein
MTNHVPKVDIIGRTFTDRDLQLPEMLLRPDGARLEAINRAIAKRVAAQSYIRDTTRLAARCGGEPWARGHGGTRRFGIRLP